MKNGTKVKLVVVIGIVAFVVVGLIGFFAGINEHPEIPIVTRIVTAFMQAGFAGVIASMITTLILYMKK